MPAMPVQRPAPAAPAPAAFSHAPVAAAVPSAVPAPVPAPELPPAQTVPMNLEELAPALDAAGIELAQTDPAKLAAAQARIATEDRPQRVGRERPARASAEEVPLVQVQTRH